MSELWELIQSHLDHYGVSSAAFARRCGASPQTVQNWKDRSTALPKPHHLREVARVIGAPYEVVLGAALVDAGYRDSVVDDAADLRERLEATAQRDNAVLAEIAERLIADLQPEPRGEEHIDTPPPPGLLEDPQLRATADRVADVIRDSLGVDDRHNGGKLGS